MEKDVEVRRKTIGGGGGSWVVGVAIKGNSKSNRLVRWALKQFASREHVVFKLLHVQARITSLPTPMGTFIPLSSVREDVAALYRTEVEGKTKEMLLLFQKIFVQNKVESDIRVIESDDIAEAIAEMVKEQGISNLVIGPSSSNFFKRKSKRSDLLSQRILDCTPNICTVYIVSKGRLLSTRPSAIGIRDGRCEGQSSSSSSQQTELGTCHRFPSSPLFFQRCRASSTGNKRLGAGTGRKKRTGSLGTAYSEISSWKSSRTDTQTLASGQNSSSSTGYMDSSSFGSQMNSDFEVEKLKNELRHVREMYVTAQTEIVDASKKLRDLNQYRLEEATKLSELTIREEERDEVAERAVEGEINALEQHQFLKFTWEEIIEITSSFSEDLKIGSGAYSSVYKCCLHHTTVAVKVLHLDKNNAFTPIKQFEQELEILSKIRHPHLLLLVGACPERGCLVYEYMHNGSLEQRLLRPNNTKPAIPWFERFRIAWEIASALHFLHTTKPKPIVHRDLKPANILLDHNLVSKIADVGLSKIVDLDSTSHISTTLFNNTRPVGTFFYIDPEYQRTGLVSPDSDVYAFGIIILQLLTGRPPMGLAHMAEKAILKGKFAEILDLMAGIWPLEETRELVGLGLRCTELRRKDRPDLSREVLPVLERLKDVACEARKVIWNTQINPPTHFICPIRKDIMEDPCVAADGYTYDRRAIEAWFQRNNSSPVTDLPFPNKNLLPNYSLLSAIKEWKSNEQ